MGEIAFMADYQALFMPRNRFVKRNWYDLWGGSWITVSHHGRPVL